MRILIAAATEAEIAPTREWLSTRTADASGFYSVGICITGVGLLAATYELATAIATDRPDYVIGAGIAGAFSKELKPGQCVIVASEQVADFGAEDGADFLDAFSIGLAKANHSPYTHRLMKNPLVHPPFPIEALAQVAGLTVMTVSGHEPTIARRAAHYSAEIETMEGAALHYVCLRQNIPFVQLRAISNYVERRNRQAWKMDEAIQALNAQLAEWL